MKKRWSDYVIDDIIGAFRIFFVSAILIYIALIIAKTLYPTFPLDNQSSGIVSVILGLFLTFLKFIKERNKH